MIKNFEKNDASIILINTSDRFLEVIFGHPILLDHGKNNFGMEIIKINYWIVYLMLLKVKSYKPIFLLSCFVLYINGSFIHSLTLVGAFQNINRWTFQSYEYKTNATKGQ